LFTTSHTTNL